MPEHDVAGLGDVVVELQAGQAVAEEQPAELALAVLEREAAQVLAIVRGLSDQGMRARLYDSEINFEVSGFYDAASMCGLAITSMGSA